MVGIGNSQLTVNLTTRDVTDMRLTATATGMTAANGGFIWNPTTKYILRTEEVDKQNDDNLTFLFEYRALLNSRLQTLITQLSNALTADIEVAMSAQNPGWAANPRSAMNGNSNATTVDAGAARTAFNYMLGWYNEVDGVSPAAGAIANNGALDNGGIVGASNPWNVTFSSAEDANLDTNTIGTATIVQAATGTIDRLIVSNLDGVGGVSSFNFMTESADSVNAGYNVMDDSFDGPLGVAATSANAKNMFERVLFDAVSSVEYKPVLQSGLFKNLIVTASSSLATGSQTQAGLILNYNGSESGGSVNIELSKFTAFYHS